MDEQNIAKCPTASTKCQTPHPTPKQCRALHHPKNDRTPRSDALLNTRNTCKNKLQMLKSEGLFHAFIRMENCPEGQVDLILLGILAKL